MDSGDEKSSTSNTNYVSEIKVLKDEIRSLRSDNKCLSEKVFKQ
jgi:hypothetical protein